jgi:hypothetical protein
MEEAPAIEIIRRSVNGQDDEDETRSVRSNARSLNIKLNSVGRVRRHNDQTKAISKPRGVSIREHNTTSKAKQGQVGIRDPRLAQSINLRQEGLELLAQQNE